jgi:hypothetical protein
VTFVVATLLYPALLAALAAGTGLLVERVAGRQLNPLLLAPLGLAGLVVVAQLTTLKAATAPLTPIALVVCAVAGFVVGARRLRPLWTALRANPWPLVAAAIVYVIACAPVLFAGRLTEAAYLLDTTAGIQVAGADRILSHALDFSDLAPSGYKLTLQAYFGTSYPSGAHTLFAGSGRLIGGNLLWLYQPFLAAMLAFCVPSLYLLGKAVGMPRRVAFVAAILAATPALVYAYALQGAIKEITLLPVIVLLAALVVEQRAWMGSSVFTYVPLGLAAASGIAVVGIAFGPWVLLASGIAVVVAVVALRRRRLSLRRFAIQVAAVALVVVIASLPTLLDLRTSTSLASGLSQGNQAAAQDPGNLLQPIHAVQSLGVWLHGSHRVDPPKFMRETYGFIGAFLVAVALGLVALVRRRAWALLTFVAGAGVIWWLLTSRGTVWTDAKLIVLSSPFVVLLACVGANGLFAARRRVEGTLLLAALVVGIVWSDALAYHDTNLAPTDRFEELSAIGTRFAGDGPALLPDFDEYSLYLARQLDVDAPGFAYKSPALGLQIGGAPTGYGQTYDLDALPLESVRRYPLLVIRRSPEHSHPATGYQRVSAGEFYEVWRRTPQLDTVISHVGSGRGLSPTGKPSCARVKRAAARAQDAGGVLRYLQRPPLRVVSLRKAALTSNFTPFGDGAAMLSTGRIDTTARFPRGGRFTVWLKGDFTRLTQVVIDDRLIGQVSYQSGGEGNYATPFRATIQPGRRRLAIRRPGGSLLPGDNSIAVLRNLVFVPDGPVRVVDVDPKRWRSVCDKQVDWVEAIRKTA